jgi:predicted transcriptional regulator
MAKAKKAPPTSMTLRVDENLRRVFTDACNSRDRTASQVIRDFMREYVAKNAQQELKL